ncbi:hypothetical protein RHGRI_006950 [Rhododendron griersonianum]|uniref:Uncharacterized protein n=1 Tax=Rhododendron griersonianum TaxID=479676 RepID=A0AAV6KWL7_9ERIC|nr:hypothetical protein RHGRI_006950 [Rhododendron griersonianum]
MEGSTGSCDGDSNVLCNCGIRASFNAKGYLYRAQYAGKDANFKAKLEGNGVELEGSGFGLSLNSSRDLRVERLIVLKLKFPKPLHLEKLFTWPIVYGPIDFRNMEKMDQSEDRYDAIVVGSGYGGSVAACRMSMAGIKVCLVEKGRRWESKDFPTDSLKILSAVRVENQNLGFSFGPKDALFQVSLSLSLSERRKFLAN